MMVPAAAAQPPEAVAQPPEAVAQPPEAAAQPPAAAGPPGVAACARRGRLHRMFHHTAHTLDDTFIGYPDAFIEPPLGTYIRRQFVVQVAKADPHRGTLYQSDFLPGTDRFSPIGASRFNLMLARLPAWSGPILIEWSPDQPALAEARRRAVLATLDRAGQPVPGDRVVIGPSPYPGALGVETAGNYGNLIGRSQAAAVSFPLSPAVSANLGVR
jgi:hypothetical protein